jgi:hypothetical protein
MNWDAMSSFDVLPMLPAHVVCCPCMLHASFLCLGVPWQTQLLQIPGGCSPALGVFGLCVA